MAGCTPTPVLSTANSKHPQRAFKTFHHWEQLEGKVFPVKVTSVHSQARNVLGGKQKLKAHPWRQRSAGSPPGYLDFPVCGLCDVWSLWLNNVTFVYSLGQAARAISAGCWKLTWQCFPIYLRLLSAYYLLVFFCFLLNTLAHSKLQPQLM